MELDFALLADAATIDASGKLNVLGVFDRIFAAEFPARHDRISLVFRLSAGVRELGAHPMEIRLTGPGGKEVLKLDGTLQLGGGPRGASEGLKQPHVLNLDGIVFAEAGRYAFDISVDGTPLVSLPLILEGARPGSMNRPGRSSTTPPFPFGPGGGAQA